MYLLIATVQANTFRHSITRKALIIDEYTQQVNVVFAPSFIGLQMGMMFAHESSYREKANRKAKHGIYCYWKEPKN